MESRVVDGWGRARVIDKSPESEEKAKQIQLSIEGRETVQTPIQNTSQNLIGPLSLDCAIITLRRCSDMLFISAGNQKDNDLIQNSESLNDDPNPIRADTAIAFTNPLQVCAVLNGFQVIRNGKGT
jgi:hypothetical protein